MAHVLALDRIGFWLSKVLDALFQWLPVIFNENGFAFFIDPFVSIHTRTLHLPVVSRNAPRREQESNHVGCLR
ncbi:hypothetical protein D3C78_1182180 [compost metagenome]